MDYIGIRDGVSALKILPHDKLWPEVGDGVTG